MRVQQFFAVAGLLLAGNGVIAAKLERDDVPRRCWEACGPVVGTASSCDARHDNDSAELKCICNWGPAKTQIPLCAACITQSNRDNDRDHDHDRDDDDDDRDNDRDNDRDYDDDNGMLRLSDANGQPLIQESSQRPLLSSTLALSARPRTMVLLPLARDRHPAALARLRTRLPLRTLPTPAGHRAQTPRRVLLPQPLPLMLRRVCRFPGLHPWLPWWD